MPFEDNHSLASYHSNTLPNQLAVFTLLQAVPIFFYTKHDNFNLHFNSPPYLNPGSAPANYCIKKQITYNIALPQVHVTDQVT